MKSALILAPLAAAFVVPNTHVFSQIPIEANNAAQQHGSAIWDRVPSLGDVADRIKKPFGNGNGNGHSHADDGDNAATEPYTLDAALAGLESEVAEDFDPAQEALAQYGLHIEETLAKIGKPEFLPEQWKKHGGNKGRKQRQKKRPGLFGSWFGGDEHDGPPRHGDKPPPPPPHGGDRPPPPPEHGDKPPPPPPEHGDKPHHPPPGEHPGHGDHPHPPPPHHGPPPHGPPGHGPPGHGPPGHGPPHHGKPHRGHGPHHHAPNATIYQLISSSKWTQNLTKLIDSDKDLVKLLNSTKTNTTFVVPPDFALRHLPDEYVKKALKYHLLAGVQPSYKLVFAHTTPTLYEPKSLGGYPQRLQASFQLLRGVFFNHYSKVLAKNIPATNGILHAVKTFLFTPPSGLAIITHLPTTFSTLEIGLHRTGLYDVLNTTGSDRLGGTLFAPTNLAFKKLGPRANAFLFSKYGEKYLKALLAYHVVPRKALYSNHLYTEKKDDSSGENSRSQELLPLSLDGGAHRCPHHSKDASVSPATAGSPPSYVHLDLPTLLHGTPVNVDLVRYGPWIDFKINGFVRVAVQDGVTSDGVIQVVNSVLVPPKKPDHGEDDRAAEALFWDGEREMEVEEIKERLERFVETEEEEGRLEL